MYQRLARGGVALVMAVAISAPVAAGAQDGGYVPSTVAPTTVASTTQPSQVGNLGASAAPTGAATTTGGSSLPVTGDDSGRLALVGGTLTLAGVGLVMAARRRRTGAAPVPAVVRD